MSFIQDKIKKASQQYYSTGTSDLSDEEFDALLEQERKDNPNSDLLETGHGYDVSLDSTSGEKVHHKYGLVGSLPKCRKFEELSKSLKTCTDVIASLKLDGLSVVLYFINGILTSAVTRGNGTVGIDITNKVLRILNNGIALDVDFTGAIRGEIVMSNENFKEFQKLHPEAKNSRNSATGLINCDEVRDDLKFLDIIVYTVVGSENIEFTTYSQVLSFLSENFGYTKVVPHKFFNTKDWKVNFEESMNDLKSAWYDKYPADGIVLANNDLIIDDSVIEYDSMAYKFKAESKITTVQDIEWNLSKFGYMIPRIKFDELELSGAKVQYCTGHNAANIRDLRLGIGAKIQVCRSNEVIPYLETVVENTSNFSLPETCPKCGKEPSWNGVHLQCTNPECLNNDIQDVLIWFKHIVPTDGLGDTLILKFLEEIFGEDNISIEKIYSHGPLTTVESGKYVKLDLFVETFNRLFTNEVELSDAIEALNIPRFGHITSIKAAEYPEVIQAAMNDEDIPHTVYQLGDANSSSLVENKNKFKRLKFIENQIDWTVDNSSSKEDVCITGKLSVKRPIFEELVKKAGFNPVSSVKSDTKYLITDDPNSGSSKNKAADKYGVEKITEQEFRSRFM